MNGAQSLTKGRAQAIVGMMVPWEASWAPLGLPPAHSLATLPLPLSFLHFLALGSLAAGTRGGADRLTLEANRTQSGCHCTGHLELSGGHQLGMKTQHLTASQTALTLTPNSGRSQTSSPLKERTQPRRSQVDYYPIEVIQ